jgi:hypothetical protein
MPYKSEKQRKYMHAKHPGIAARWDKETGGKVVGAKKAAAKPIRKGEPSPAKSSMKGRLKKGPAPKALQGMAKKAGAYRRSGK